MSLRAVRYYSMGDASGYGMAGLGYVRGLVNAGVAVEWVRLRWQQEPLSHPLQSCGDDLGAFAVAPGLDGSLSDLATLVRLTTQRLHCDVVIAHTTPDYWPAIFGATPGALRVGLTAWETDRPPAYWMPLVDLSERLVVPCRMNRDVFEYAGVRAPVRVVPHTRQHAIPAFTAAELQQVRAQFALPEGHAVYYTIGAWDPRKAMPDLIDAFARAFRADDRVVLVIKTQATGHDEDPLQERRPTRALFEATTQRLQQRLGRALPPLRLIDDSLTDRGIAALHALGDCYVSLTHGEGWGLGAFDAATLGKPVIITAWSAPPDYLAGDNGTWPGAVPFRMTNAPAFPAFRPSYFPTQRWAQPDIDAAAALLRVFHADAAAMRAAAQTTRADIVNRFAEPVVTRCLLDAFDG